MEIVVKSFQDKENYIVHTRKVKKKNLTNDSEGKVSPLENNAKQIQLLKE